MSFRRVAKRTATLALAATLLIACRAAGVKQSGIRMGDDTLEQFKAGSTKEEWLIAVVGPPTSRTDMPDGVSILRYSTEEKSTGVMDFFNGGSSRNTATIYFIVRNGVVEKFWADRETERTLFGKEVEKKSGEKK